MGRWRTFHEDVLACPRCHARLEPIPVIRRHEVIDRILRHLALPPVPAVLTHPETVAFDVTGEPMPDWVVGVEPDPPDAEDCLSHRLGNNYAVRELDRVVRIEQYEVARSGLKAKGSAGRAVPVEVDRSPGLLLLLPDGILDEPARRPEVIGAHVGYREDDDVLLVPRVLPCSVMAPFRTLFCWVESLSS